MRGFLAPAVSRAPSESQTSVRTLSRSRRSKLAKAANTTLLKADQWARGDVVTADVGAALEHAFAQTKTKKK
jgi:hypothetical protein